MESNGTVEEAVDDIEETTNVRLCLVLRKEMGGRRHCRIGEMSRDALISFVLQTHAAALCELIDIVVSDCNGAKRRITLVKGVGTSSVYCLKCEIGKELGIPFRRQILSCAVVGVLEDAFVLTEDCCIDLLVSDDRGVYQWRSDRHEGGAMAFYTTNMFSVHRTPLYNGACGMLMMIVLLPRVIPACGLPAYAPEREGTYSLSWKISGGHLCRNTMLGALSLDGNGRSANMGWFVRMSDGSVQSPSDSMSDFGDVRHARPVKHFLRPDTVLTVQADFSLCTLKFFRDGALHCTIRDRRVAFGVQWAASLPQPNTHVEVVPEPRLLAGAESGNVDYRPYSPEP
jgi:hypothetical protein